MKKQIGLAIRGERESAEEFVKAWRRAEEGKPPERPVERVYFEDLTTMLKVLTPRRLALLKTLHGSGPLSVRAVALLVKRDYKNVHRDLQILERVGLVVRTADNRLTAPWKKIIAEVALAA